MGCRRYLSVFSSQLEVSGRSAIKAKQATVAKKVGLQIKMSIFFVSTVIVERIFLCKWQYATKNNST
jgi:hypothetical protein